MTSEILSRKKKIYINIFFQFNFNFWIFNIKGEEEQATLSPTSNDRSERPSPCLNSHFSLHQDDRVDSLILTWGDGCESREPLVPSPVWVSMVLTPKLAIENNKALERLSYSSSRPYNSRNSSPQSLCGLLPAVSVNAGLSEPTVWSR